MVTRPAAIAIVLLCLGTVTEAQPPLLDLTPNQDLTASEPGGEVGGPEGGVTGGGLGSLGASIALSQIEQRTYELHEPFIFEVTLTNTSNAALLLPWSGVPQSTTSLSSHVEAHIDLVAVTPSGRRYIATTVRIYGSTEQQGTIRSVAPGESVRVLAPGSWVLVGDDVATEIGQEPTAVTVEVTYALRASPTSWQSTTYSPPITLHLKRLLQAEQ